MFSRVGLFEYFDSSSPPHSSASESKIDSKLDTINTAVQTVVENLDEAHKNPLNSIKTFPLRLKPNGNPEKKTIDSKLKKALWAALGCWSTYNLIDRGLSSFLVMETLTHGTGPLGYIGININGADPNYGGGETGSSVGGGVPHYINNSKRKFHVFKDTEFSFDSEPIHNSLLRQALPRQHAVLSGMANFGVSLLNGKVDAKGVILGGISGFLTPTLKFRFTPDEVINCGDSCIFENDPDYAGCAYRTTEALPANRLGMTGSLVYGVNSDMFNRMSTNPQKMLVGASLLAAGILLGKKTYDYYKSDSVEQTKITDSKEKMSYFERFKKELDLSSQLKFSGKITMGIFLNTL
jgi:hypothetical protein